MTVSKGDLLGYSFAGADFAPYCHLEYAVSSNSSNRLFQQGLGQNSLRGLSGMISPVYQRSGKSMKFFVNYQ